jgi:hypothetical protein
MAVVRSGSGEAGGRGRSVGPTCQPDAERGEGGMRLGRFPAMEVEIGQARGPTGPMERGGIPGKSGPT